MAVVTLSNIGKQYPNSEEWAVNDVSFTVADGEFMVLLGPSGCGKSTTLRMVAGLEAISAGTLAIDDEVMNRVPAKDRDIAMVFQSYALYPHMTVRDNLAFGLRRRGFARDEITRRVEDVASMLGLAPFLERKPFALSGGQRQRVAVGRAVVRDPKVFLFDEPLSNLDAALRVSTRNELMKQHRRLGATMIYVTHDQVEAMTMGTRICIMNEGRLVQVGPPLEVYRHPADTFVARFLGNPPMNLVDGVLVNQAGSMEAQFGENRITLPGHDPSLLSSHGDRRVIIGFRPEDMYESRGRAQAGRAEVAADVTTVESLGAETLLGLKMAEVDQEVTARIGRDSRARVGDKVVVQIDLSAIQIFDAETTMVISKAGPADNTLVIERNVS